MNTKITLLFSIFIFTFSGFSQTTAMNFIQNDCNGNPQNLFSDLDAGQAVVLFYYMPNCSTCPPPAANIQAMANKINATCPGMVKGYANSYLNSTSCAYTASWVTSNNLNFYTPMGGTGADEVAYYGGFGMPTVVLVGGTNHDVLFVTQNWVDSDTTTMRDLILNMACVASTEELNSNFSVLSVYPNPTVDELSFSINAPNNESVFIEMEDITGRVVVAKREVKSENGLVQSSLDLSGLPDGNYILKAEMNGVIITQKVLVQH
jgi:hypothetical protein